MLTPRGRVRAGLAAAALTTAAVAAPCVLTNAPPRDCLDLTRDTVAATEADATTKWPHADIQTPSRTFDARGRTWSLPGTAYAWKLHRDRTAVDACLVGGTITTTLDPATTTWDTWHGHTAVISQKAGTRITGTRLGQVGDGFALYRDAEDWLVDGVRVDLAYDDCVEDDAMEGGTISDSFFNCGSSFLSATTPNSTYDGTEETVTVDGVLARMVPIPHPFNEARYGVDRHGGFFKFAERLPVEPWGIPPRLVVRDSMFRSDTRGAYGARIAGGPNGLPPGSTCERVTLIGDGWSPAELASWTTQCDDLTVGSPADWDAAVEAWEAAHPGW